MEKTKKDAAKLIAFAKKETVKRELKNRKKLKNNPLPQYLEMPPPTGNAETDSLQELNSVQIAFRKRLVDEKAEVALATDSEYWFCVCFQSREQKEHLLSQLKLIDIGIGNRYIDGAEVAKRLGVDLPESKMKYRIGKKPDAEFIKLTQ